MSQKHFIDFVDSELHTTRREQTNVLLFLLLSNFGKTTFTKSPPYYPVFDTFYIMVSLWYYLLVVFADK